MIATLKSLRFPRDQRSLARRVFAATRRIRSAAGAHRLQLMQVKPDPWVPVHFGRAPLVMLLTRRSRKHGIRTGVQVPIYPAMTVEDMCVEAVKAGEALDQQGVGR